MLMLGLRFGAGLVGGTEELTGLDKLADAECDIGFTGRPLFEVVRCGIVLGFGGLGDGKGDVLVWAVGFGGLRLGGGRVLGLRVGGGRGRGVRTGRGCRAIELEPLGGETGTKVCG